MQPARSLLSQGAKVASPSSLPLFVTVVQIAYRSPFDAAATAGKLLTRKSLF
jgi:hypothetical protein